MILQLQVAVFAQLENKGTKVVDIDGFYIDKYA